MTRIFFFGVPCTPPNVNGYLFSPVEDHAPFYSAEVAENDLGRFAIGEPDCPFLLELPGSEDAPLIPLVPKAPVPPPFGEQKPDGPADGANDAPVTKTPEQMLASVNKIQKKADIVAWAATENVAVVLDPETQTRDQMIALVAEAIGTGGAE